MPEQAALERADLERVIKLARDARMCMLTTLTEGGSLVSRPMSPREVTDDGDLWFLTDTTSAQSRQVRGRPQVNLAFATGSSWLSISGDAQVIHDPARVRELWSAAAEAWFPDGPDDSRLGLLLVTGRTAEYWDAPCGRIATVLSFVKAKVTGQALAADNETVRLP